MKPPWWEAVRCTSSIKAAQDSDVRLVLIGDAKQLQSIDAGRMFHKLQDAGIRTVLMTESIRQRDEGYRDIVRDIAHKRIDHAFGKLEASDRIHEIGNREDRLTALVSTYAKSDVENVLVVTTLNRDRKEINGLIRDELKHQGRLDKEDHAFHVREPKTLSAIERRFARNYEPGDIVTVNRPGAGIKVGSQGVVTGINERDHAITVHTRGTERMIDLQNHGDKISVYVEHPVAFTEGEKVVFLKNDKRLGVANGLTGLITTIGARGEITLRTETDKDLTLNVHEYPYLDLGYAVTDYKSQGQTAKEVIFHADTAREVSHNSFYVALTRGQNDVHVYTNDKEMLQEQVKAEQEKTSTLDYPDRPIGTENSASGVERESANGGREDAGREDRDGKETFQEREQISSTKILGTDQRRVQDSTGKRTSKTASTAAPRSGTIRAQRPGRSRRRCPLRILPIGRSTLRTLHSAVMGNPETAGVATRQRRTVTNSKWRGEADHG